MMMIMIIIQWEFQDPKMEVLYHIRPYFVGTKALYRVGTINKSVPEMAIDVNGISIEFGYKFGYHKFMMLGF
jgi:hypothetical protein